MSKNYNFTPFNYGPPKSQPKTKPSSYLFEKNISQSTSNYGIKKQKTSMNNDDNYFDEDEDDDETNGNFAVGNKQAETDDEEDPLDAFMAGLEESKEKKSNVSIESSNQLSSNKGFRADIEDIDSEELFYKYMEENSNAGVIEDNSDDNLEYDEEGNPIVTIKKKFIDPLPPVDHSQIKYEPFEKNFYFVHDEISSLSRNQIVELRHKLGIKVSGATSPAPVCSFAHFGFDERLLKAIRKSEYVSPTPIQAQGIPAALSGLDIICIAKTGSGKTAAFLWPLIIHILDQPNLKPGDGPIGLILSPTRELAIQIYNEAKKFGKTYDIKVTCAYGGGNKYEQLKALEKGAEIIVATPGRMIDLIKTKATNLLRCSYLVLDEADKMFNLGFEAQVRSICNHVNPLRQTLLFSATFKKRIEKLARDILKYPIRIVQGDIGRANEDITQHALIFEKPELKWSWLLERLVEFLSEGSVLIFVSKKLDAEKLAADLKLKEFPCLLLHGDIEQAERNRVISAFKKKECDILVGTDVVGRGLDIPHIKTVINYDMARDIDTHTHRIGRTARGGEKGTAYTLLSEKDKEMVGHLVINFEGANQFVPDNLMQLALKSSWFRKSRFKGGKEKSILGGAGLGFSERERQESQRNSSYLKSFIPENFNEPKEKVNHSQPTNRLDALKAVFKSQYLSQYKTSSEKTTESKDQQQMSFAKPESYPSPSPLTSTDNSEPKKKKSRWN